MKNPPKLSVLMLAYNHEKYISDAVKSVVSQKTDFKFELVIYDDASIDSTQRQIFELQKKYPNLIKIKLRKKNVGMMKNFNDIIKNSKSEYLAICEGDDYWTDDNKLQLQVDFLDNNNNYSICSHNVMVKDELSGKEHEWLGKDHRSTSTIKDILRYGSNGATCSLVFRRNEMVIKEYINLSKKIHGGDWLIQILSTQCGKMKYFPEVMGVYRRHNQGATTPNTFKKHVDIFDRGGVNICNILNKHFNYKYDKQIKHNLVEYFYPNLMNVYRENKDIKKARYYAKKIIKEGLFSSQFSFDKWVGIFLLLTPVHRFQNTSIKKVAGRVINKIIKCFTGNTINDLVHNKDGEKKRDLKRLGRKVGKKLKKPVKIHIGCGPRVLKGWVNIDLAFEPCEKYLQHYTDVHYGPKVRGSKKDFFAIDVTKTPLPFQDNTVDVVFHEDFIEHLDQKEQILFLAEMFRVLRPGAIHRINTPNLLSPFLMDKSKFDRGLRGVYTDAWDKYLHKNVLTPAIIKELAKITGYSKVEFKSRDNSSAINIPTEYRPDDSNESDDWNIFADLTK